MAEKFQGFKDPLYTQIPHEMTDDIQPKIPATRFSVLIHIARWTLGFHRESIRLSISKIAEGTGLSERCVNDCLRDLVESGYVNYEANKNPDGSRSANTYSLRMFGDPASDWEEGPSSAKTTKGNSGENFSGGEKAAVMQKTHSGMQRLPTLKEITLKENKEKNYISNPLPPSSKGSTLSQEESSKLLCSWFKQLRGIVSFPKVLRELVHSNVQRLDEDLLGLLPTAWYSWKQETYWADFQADHKVRAFFAYLKTYQPGPRNGRPEATEGSSIVARAQSRVEAPPSLNGGPAGHSPDNGSVVVQMWNAAMPERETSLKSAFIGPDPQKIIERCSYIISNHPDKDWLTLEWICQTKDGKPGWQKIMEQKYDWLTKPQKPAYPGGRPSYLDVIERRVAARHAAEAAAAAQAEAEGGTESDEDE